MISNQDKSHTQQIRYVFLAFLFGATGIVDYLVKYPIEIYPFGYISAFLLIATVAYAIRKHHLLDIEIFIKRGAVYSILTALLTGIFVSIILVWERFFIGATGYGSIWIGIIVAFVISVLFQPLRDSVQEIVDRTFFRARYDYQRILNRYSRALTQPMADLSRFSRIAPYLLTKSLRLAGASFLVLDRENRQIVVRAGEREAAETEGVVLSDDSPLINELRRRKKELSLEEVKARIKAGEETDKYRSISDEMAGLKIVLAIPSITDSEYFGQPTLIAVLCLGPKLSDQGYSAEDINFLDTLANQATISIEYAFILEELKRNQERVLRSEKLAVIGTTTAGVAHELKNPLTYLSAVAQVLPLKWDDPKFRESVVQMFPSEVQRMQLIIEGLLDYSRSRELSMKPLDIKSVTDKALALLAYEIKKKKVYIKTDYQHARQVNGDPNRLMQVFMNLMANAVQAMGDKGGDLKIRTEDADGEVRVNICDTGPGIAADQLRKIFDPFFSTKEAGTGLGLPISKKIVDEHQGAIYVDSKVGEGTTFTVCLPIAA